jgi:hypothetical protein
LKLCVARAKPSQTLELWARASGELPALTVHILMLVCLLRLKVRNLVLPLALTGIPWEP